MRNLPGTGVPMSKVPLFLCSAQYLGSQRKELRAGVKAAGKRLWMSEFGCGSSPPNGMKAALELSSVILKVLFTLP